MNIRKAKTTDLTALLVLNEQIGMLHFENAPEAFIKPSEADKEFLKHALSDPSRLFLVAEIENRVVGFLTAFISKNEAIPFLVRCPICRVGTIVVDENCRTSGVGTELMQACSRWAKSQGAAQIRLEVMAFNQPAQHFYEKLGFKAQSHILCKMLGE
ncbi:GNAT family N-acetyltransferase [Photobacterium sp. GJ3]|uniref:GNAT family N-acetyltransferase n=1 Tax=Photobacterium sp. GJ3 TaxID=2829502 RepID=UPI001B8CDB63|nr:GNAT family N-acetyltransferase [Photobacterium sp. GJ3]QUJ69110.1 GNAT family N-acetyltransferase [Photobacterium sp. GJ3]